MSTSGSKSNEHVAHFLVDIHNPTKVNLGRDVENDVEALLKACDFVYVTESGKTIHANRFCGSGYANLVPFSHAVLHGYTKLCKKCAQGTYVEVLFEKYGLK